jgi:pyruvate,water dikinase
MSDAGDFPVEWERPEDAELNWRLYTLHGGGPMPRLSYSFLVDIFVPGYQDARRAYGLSVGEVHLRLFNNFCYEAVSRIEAPQKGDRNLDAAADEVGGLWGREILPEVRRHVAFLDRFDLRGATDAALRVHLQDTWQRMKVIWKLHFDIGYPYMVAISRFDDTYRELFGDAEPLASFRLLQGFDNERLRADRAIWLMARRARDGGDADLATAVQTLLPQQGHRGDGWMPHDRRWDEEPAALVEALRAQMGVERDPEVTLAHLARDREKALAQARSALSGRGRAAAEGFEGRLRAAQQAIVVQEDHSWWIDSRASHWLRRVALEIGRRLVESGDLEAPEDLLQLSIEELHQAISPPGRFGDAGLVSRRKAAMERFAKVTPPATLGSPVQTAPESAFKGPADAVDRALDKYFGQPVAEYGPRELRGHAASPGVARGPARVVRSRRDAEQVRPGDVLVTSAAGPDWTPLFSVISGLVTEFGGVASHAAGVAREYGLPAVTGAAGATRTIGEGDLVEVDGARGVVRILHAAASGA